MNMTNLRITDIANRVLNQRVRIMDGSIRIFQALNDLGMSNDQDFMIFQFINSESDNFPLGRERKEWSKSALKIKDLELAKFEKFYKEDVFKACKKIIKRFSSK